MSHAVLNERQAVIWRACLPSARWCHMRFDLLGIGIVTLFFPSVLCASQSAPAESNRATCMVNGENLVTVSGTLRLLSTIVHPFVWPDGSQDFSVVDTIDEYELSSPDWICSHEPLLVRFRYGHVKAVSCAENVPAMVSGFYRRDMDDGPAYLSVMMPGDIRCEAPPAP